MADDKAGATIEIPEDVKDEVVVPEVAELREAGFREEEIKAAKKHGLVKPEGDKKNEDETEKAKKEKESAELLKKQEAEKAAKEKEQPPDISALLVQLDKVEDERQVHEILNKMGIDKAKDHDFYMEARQNRRKRQTAQAERDRALLELKFQQQKAAELEKRISDLEKGDPKKKSDEDDFVVDELTGEKKEKPLTRSDLEKMASEQEEAAKKDYEKKSERARVVMTAVNAQENEAKERYQDFDNVIDAFTTDILKNINALDKIFPDDPKTQRKVRTLARQAMMAASNADQIPEGELNAADISYEIGTLHPKFKAGGTPEAGKNGVEADPEKVKKALEESNKSRSSAGLSGGSARRSVSVQDLTVEDVLKLSQSEFARLRKEHPKVVEKLLREK